MERADLTQGQTLSPPPRYLMLLSYPAVLRFDDRDEGDLGLF